MRASILGFKLGLKLSHLKELVLVLLLMCEILHHRNPGLMIPQ